MIYTRFGAPVNLTSCEVVREKSQRGDEYDQYYVTAELADKYPDGSGVIGQRICDGRQFGAYELKAVGGWGEILDACKVLNQAVAA